MSSPLQERRILPAIGIHKVECRMGNTESVYSYTINVKPLYQVTFSYQVSGGGSGYSSPSVTYTSLGSQHTVTAGPSATVAVDPGSTYTYNNNPLAGSGTNERWQALTGTSGTISAAGTIAPTYYNQYSFTFSYSVSGGGTGYSAPVLSSTQFGSGYNPTLTGSAMGYWLDATSSWSVTNPLQGSVINQRWQTVQSVSGSVSSTQTTLFTYYYQYSFALSYSVLGGGSGYSAPTFSSREFGATFTSVLTTSSTQCWLDMGSSWSLPSLLFRARDHQSVGRPRRQPAALFLRPKPLPSHTTISTHSFSSMLYQVEVAVTQRLPLLTLNLVTDLQLRRQRAEAASVWIDAGTTYSYANPLSGSSSSEQWSTNSASGTVVASVTVSKTYYNQFNFALSYSISGAGSGYSAPLLSSTQFGSPYAPTLTGTTTGYWLDAGAHGQLLIPSQAPLRLSVGKQSKPAAAQSQPHKQPHSHTAISTRSR